MPFEQIHLTLDVSEQLPTKLASLHCHRTQASPEMDHIDWSQGELAEMYSTEYLIQADPPVPDGATIDPDIFAGLNTE